MGGGKKGHIKVPSSTPAGTYTMEFRAQDDDGWSHWKTFTIVVRPQHPPIATDVSRSITQGNSLTWNLNGTGGITRTDGDKIDTFQTRNRDPHIQFDGSVSHWRYGKYGRITVGSSVPAGTYTMEFRAKDDDGWSAWKTFSITITPQTPPTTSNILLQYQVNNNHSYNLMNKTTRTDGDPITKFRLSGTVPAFVSLGGSHNKYLRVRPHTGDRGVYTFKFEAQDNDGWSTPSTITLIIINKPPIVDIPDFVYRAGNPALNIQISNYTTPTNGDPILSYAWLAGDLPAGLHWSGGQASPPSSTVYEDAENGNTAGWDIYDNNPSGATITNVYDSVKKSRVIQLSGSYTNNGYRLTSPTWYWKNTTQHIISWDMKYSENYHIYVMVRTTHGFRYIDYTHSDSFGSGTATSRSVRHGLGSGTKDGHWHTIIRDLEADLHDFQPGNHITRVDGFLIRGSGRIDNVKLISNPHLAGAGAFQGSPTQAGEYYITAGAKDAGGIGYDTFKLKVIIPEPPIASNVSRSILRGSGLLWQLTTTGGIRRTDGDKIIQFEDANNTSGYIHFDKTISDSANGKLGKITINPSTPPGTYTMMFRAKDRDGWSDWKRFLVKVNPGTPPIAANVSRSILQGNSLTHNLNGTRGITRTDGDNIDAFNIRNKDPHINFDGNVSGVLGKSGRITVSASVPAGTYSLQFRAHDVDGWSAWKTFTVVVKPINHTSDICYNRPNYRVFPIVGTPMRRLFCHADRDYGNFRGGPGCQQIITLKNAGTENLTQVEISIDQDPAADNDIPMFDCSIHGGGTCQSPSHYTWGSHDFHDGIKFVMPNFAPDANETIDIRTSPSIALDPPPNRAMMDGTNLYVKYRDSSNTLHISRVPFCADGADYAMDVDSNFSLIYGGPGTAVLGDMATTGDSILYAVENNNTQDNDHYNGTLSNANTSYILTDAAFVNAADGNKSNASTAKLNLPSYVKAEHIKWAGLFWQGYVHEPHAAGKTLAQIKANLDTRQWNTVKIKNPDGTYANVTADSSIKDVNNSTYHLLMVDHDSYRFFYSSYKNITSIVKSHFDDNLSTHMFTVGDILTTAGTDTADSLYVPHANNGNGKWFLDTFGGGGSVGYFGGWSLVVVYDLIGTTEAASSSEAYKNVSLYNGYDFFTTGGDGNVTFATDVAIAGFKTPKHGTVNSKLLLFGGGADKTMSPDILKIQKKKDTSTFVDVSNGKNPANNQFNSTYTVNNTEINPNKPNHQGMDLDIIDVSSHMDHDQSTTKLRFGVEKIQVGSNPSDGYCDQIFPQVLGFSTELYVPEICYDFNVHNGAYYRLPVGDDRNFSTHKIGNDPLIFGIMIKSENADFDMKNTTGGIKFHNAPALTFDASSSLYSPPSINAYLPAIDAGGDFIALGEDANSSGGTVGSNEINYAKFYYGFNDGNQVTDKFDLEVHTSVQFTAGLSPIPFVLSTDGNSSSPTHIGRCDVNQTYDPVYLWFNIERADVTDSTPNTPQDRYPLYTHVAGRDFGVSIASYSGPNFQTPHAYNSTVELEMISADSFDNDRDNGYDSVCQDPGANAIFGEGKLWDFGTTNQDRITVPSFKNNMSQIDQTVTSRNAAYRVWVLTNINTNGTRQIVDYHETDKTRFKHVYDTHYKNKDDNTTHYCTASCASDDGTTKCYECIKKYFATPVCSRDNFAIRPEGFRIEVSDANETTDINSSIVPIALTNNQAPTSVALSAGYRYRLDGTAKTFRYAHTSKGYTNIISIDNNATGRGYDDHALLAFDSTSSGTGCADTNDHDQAITFANSTTTDTPSNIDNNNTGKYNYYVTDVNWTNVDRASYPHKTVFDPTCKNSTNPNCNDCVLGSKVAPASGKVGCLTSSDSSNSNYNLIPLKFEPYKFDVTARPELQGEGNFTENNVTTSYLFMNDFRHNYFNDPSAQSIEMSVLYNGDVVARGKDGGLLTNFTENCSASNVELYLDINDSNTTSNYTLQTYLQIDDATHPYVDTQDLNVTDHNNSDHSTDFVDANDTVNPANAIILPKSAFHDSGTPDTHITGAATIVLNTTVRKQYRDTTQGINPIVMMYKKLTAKDPNAASQADMATHTPEGNNTTPLGVTYLYGKVTPGKLNYMNVTDDTRRTALYVDVYCDRSSPEYGKAYLSTPTWGADEDKLNWHLSRVFDATQIGTIDLNASTFGTNSATPYTIAVPSGTSGNPATDVSIDSPNAGMQQDINVTVGGATRPCVVKVAYTPKPWLVYDPAKNYYRVHYIGGGTWNGVGGTGKVIHTRSGRTPVPRMNW